MPPTNRGRSRSTIRALKEVLCRCGRRRATDRIPRVSQPSSTATLIPRFHLALPARLAILGALFFAEKVLLSAFVDFDRAQAAQGFGAIVRGAQHWGFRFLVVLATATTAFVYLRGGQKLISTVASAQATTIRLGWMLAHLALFAPLVPLSYLLYRDSPASLPFVTVVSLWIVLATAATLTAFAAMAPWSVWREGARALGIIWFYAVTAALLGASAMQLSQRLWAPTAALTFDLVRRLLLPILPQLHADTTNLVLSTGRFAVQISEVCSGLEGMGLMLAFCIAWLLYFRRDYIFPRTLLLIPVGLASIFVLNILRIAVLVLIGHAGFPGVAAYGFHSQAGWIAFNAAACTLVYLSRRSTWLNRSALTFSSKLETDNPTAAYVMPFLAILIAGTLSHAMSSDFERLYLLRLIAGVAMLALYRKKLATLDWRWSWRAPAVGLLVFLFWITTARFLLSPAAIPVKLDALSTPLRGIWIAGRVATSVLIVPITEELAYRGFLMRRLCDKDFESVPYRSVSWLALSVTAVVFGLPHGALWLPAILAGLAYGLVLVRRGGIGEAVVAHATTNALIAAIVLGWNQWQLW